jgi:hypothetical protein
MAYTETGTWDLGWKLGVINELPPPTFPRLISTIAITGQKYVEHGLVDYDVKGNRLIGPAEPTDMRDDPHRVGKPTDSVEQFRTQRFSEAMVFEVANELTQRYAGMPSDASLQQVIAQGYNRRAVDGLQKLKDRVSYHMQLIAWGFATGNAYSYTGRRYGIRLTGLRADDLEVELTGNDRWGESSEDPVGDIRSMMNAVSANGGVRPDMLIMSSAAFQKAMENDTFKEMWSTNANYQPQAVIPWSGRPLPKDNLESYKVPVEGRILGMDVVIAAEKTVHLDSNTDLIGEYGVMLLNRGAWASPIWYGPIYNEYAVKRGMTGVPWFPYEESMNYGRGKELVLETNRVWIPGNFNACGYINVYGSA